MTTTSQKIKTCTRCKGTGMVKSNVAHCGVPGLCYSCDGSGKTVTFTMAQRVAKYTARCEKHLEALQAEAAQLKADHESTPARNEKARARRGRHVEAELERMRASYREVRAQLAKVRATGKVTNDQEPRTLPARFAN